VKSKIMTKFKNKGGARFHYQGAFCHNNLQNWSPESANKTELRTTVLPVKLTLLASDQG